MKRLTFTCLLLFFAGAYAQKDYKKEDKRLYKEAEFFMDIEDYAMAVKLFNMVYFIDEEFPDINFKLGYSYLHLPGQQKRAVHYLEIAKSLGHTEAYFWLGRAYHADMRFSDAKKSYMYYKTKPDKLLSEKEITRFLDMTRRAESAINQPLLIKIDNMGDAINTSEDEYLPFVNDDASKLFFSSKRPENTGGVDGTGSFFDDIFMSENKDCKWSVAQPISSLNSNYHDAIVGISADGNALVINRSEKGRNTGVLHIVEYIDGKWTDPTPLGSNINTSNKEASGTFLGSDAEVIYFSSDRPGGLGGKDIWKTRKLPDGSWVEPINLGGPINTPFDEDAPFIHPNGNILYFSSNGHNTIGGYDIFKSASRGDGSWLMPENLGYPINSVNDDLYFSITRDSRSAFLASYREGGLGGSDIYKLSLIFEDKFLTPAKVKIKNAEGKAVNGIIALFESETGDLIGEYKPNKQNEFLIILKPETEYDFEITPENGETVNQRLVFTVDECQSGEITKDFVLNR